MTDSHLVVDGSNIATEGRTVPSLAQLDEAVRAFTAEFDYDNVIVVVDATFAHRIDPSERELYEEAVLAGEILTPPAGAIGRGDAFVLEIADRSGGSVLSNDSFQEFHADHEWLFEEGRLWGGKPVPGVGWVFVTRLPVRGPVSQRSRASAAKKHKTSTPAKAASKAKSSEAPKAKAAAKTAAKTRKATPTKSAKDSASPPKKRAASPTVAKTTAAKARAVSSAEATEAPDRNAADGKGRATRKRDAVNSPSAFLAFVTSHQPGDEVVGQVVEFASHGAYVNVDDTRCYLSLKSMGDPIPRSPRDVLRLGEVRSFIVEGFDTPHRGIDLALPGPVANGADPADGTESSESLDSADDVRIADQDNFLTQESAEEASVAATTKKTAAKKAPAKKATAKKVTATKKAAAKKAPAAKKTTAKKAPAAKKTAAKKAPAKKTTAAKKAPAKKTAVKKAPAKKTAAKKAPAKKTTAKKTTAAKKAPAAKKTAAKKAPAKKTAAKKAPAKKS